jgi:glycosyltransferase involved in cell wall biosynthesis
MNIGIDIRTLAESYRTGVGEFTTELLSAVFSLDSHNQYYLFANGAQVRAEQLPAWKQANVHFVITHYPNKFFNLSLLAVRGPKLDELTARRAGVPKLDVFFSPTLNFSSVSASTKHVLLVHDITFSLFPHYYTLRQRAWHKLLRPQSQCQQAGVILTPSQNTADDLVREYGIAKEKIKRLTPGLSPAFAQFAAHSADEKTRATRFIRQKYQLNEHFVLFVGAIEPRKNISALIAGFTQAANNLPPGTQLIIAGAPGWKNEAVYHAAASSAVHDRIKFIGYVPAKEKPALFAAADIFAYPSLYEGFGFPVLEAMSLGVPVITSNRSSLPEVTGAAAYLVNPHRENEIATGLTTLYKNTNLRSSQITAGLERAKNFTWHSAAESFLKTIA